MVRKSGSVIRQLGHRFKEAVDHVSDVKTVVLQSDEFADVRERITNKARSLEFKGGDLLKLAGLTVWKVLGEGRVVIPMVVQTALDHLHSSLGKRLGVADMDGDGDRDVDSTDRAEHLQGESEGGCSIRQPMAKPQAKGGEPMPGSCRSISDSIASLRSEDGASRPTGSDVKLEKYLGQTGTSCSRKYLN